LESSRVVRNILLSEVRNIVRSCTLFLELVVGKLATTLAVGCRTRNERNVAAAVACRIRRLRELRLHDGVHVRRLRVLRSHARVHIYLLLVRPGQSWSILRCCPPNTGRLIVTVHDTLPKSHCCCSFTRLHVVSSRSVPVKRTRRSLT
ncbi:hypothetical protein BAUCODRAFT_143969, partial [Baudoinia panamericana UAMH 10762]